MVTFGIGLALLIIGAVIYGAVCEKVMKPTDKKTPAVEKFDGAALVIYGRKTEKLVTKAKLQ